MSAPFAIIREHCCFELLLGFQFGTRPLVFFAPKAGNGHLMGAFGIVQVACGDRSCCVDARALFQAAQVAKIWGSTASGGHTFRALVSLQATSTSLRQGSCWIRVLPVD